MASTAACSLLLCMPTACPALQVLNKSFDLVAHVARTAQGFSKRDAIYAMEGLAEKVHELKHK